MIEHAPTLKFHGLVNRLTGVHHFTKAGEGGRRCCHCSPPIKGFSTGTGKKDWHDFGGKQRELPGVSDSLPAEFFSTQNVSEIG